MIIEISEPIVWAWLALWAVQAAFDLRLLYWKRRSAKLLEQEVRRG